MSTKSRYSTRRSVNYSARGEEPAKSNQTHAEAIEDTSEPAATDEQLKAEITRLKEEGKALRHSEHQLRLILESTSDGINIAEYDPRTGKRRLVMCNDRYVQMAGRSREELMAADDLNRFVRSIATYSVSFKERMFKALPLTGMSSWLRPDNKENYYEWTAAPLKVGDKFHIIGIDRDVTEREQSRKLAETNRYLEELAHTDEMTGLSNRRRLLDNLDRELHRIRRYGGHLALALLDVDNLKFLNDTYGHLVGDNSLVRFAAILRGEARDTDTAARYGGDEFVLLMPNATAENAINLLRRIREILAPYSIFDGKQTVRITFSGGVSEVDANSSGATPENVLRMADKALYVAKKAGRNSTKVWKHISRHDDIVVDDNLAVA